VRVGIGVEVIIAGLSHMQCKVFLFACSVSTGRGPSCATSFSARND
jgi:hypothetical protein